MCLLNHDNKLCGTYRLCRVLSANTTTGNLPNRIKVGYEERRVGRKFKSGPLTEIVVSTQQLALLVATDLMELPGEPEEPLKHNATKYSLKQSFSKAGLEEIEGPRNETPDELTKDIAINNTKRDDPEGLAKEKVRDSEPQENVFMCNATSQGDRIDASTTDGDNLKERLMETAA